MKYQSVITDVPGRSASRPRQLIGFEPRRAFPRTARAARRSGGRQSAGRNALTTSSGGTDGLSAVAGRGFGCADRHTGVHHTLEEVAVSRPRRSRSIDSVTPCGCGTTRSSPRTPNDWCRRYVLLQDKRHPADLTEPGVTPSSPNWPSIATGPRWGAVAPPEREGGDRAVVAVTAGGLSKPAASHPCGTAPRRT